MAHRVAITALLVLGIAATAAAEVQPPVALHTPMLLVPEETAGTGLMPEAEVRVSIDARGVVEKVEVLSIAPASPFDDLFRTVLVETLSRWRYAPQLRDGQPEPVRLQWKVSFPARGATDAEGAPFELRPERATEPLSPLPGGDAESRRARILDMPAAEQRALLEAQLAEALSLLDPGRRHHVETPRFVVHSDGDSRQTTEAVANNLEATYATLANELLAGIDFQTAASKVQVVVYREQAAYQRLLGALPQFEFSAGYYSPAGLIAFHLELANREHAMSLMLHEATHAFLDRHVVRRGVALPRWLGEGFPEYIANSSIRKGKLEPGRTLRQKLSVDHGDVARVRTSAAYRLDEAKNALRRGTGLGVADLLGATPETFYGDDHRLYYASAWLFVHYLRDGGPDFASQRFPRLLLYLAEGYPQIEAFEAAYGPIPAADAALREYVRRF